MKYTRISLIATFIGLSAAFGVLSADTYITLKSYAQNSWVPYPIRVFIFEDVNLRPELGAHSAAPDICPDVDESMVITLSTYRDREADISGKTAYRNLKQRALKTIPVNEEVLSYLESDLELDTLCPSGCMKEKHSAWCQRALIQDLEECAKMQSSISCAVQYNCSIICTPEHS